MDQTQELLKQLTQQTSVYQQILAELQKANKSLTILVGGLSLLQSGQVLTNEKLDLLIEQGKGTENVSDVGLSVGTPQKQ